MRLVFVMFDSLNRLALGCYGGSGIKTPHFNRFAEKAITFDTHYVGSLPCMPARRDLHTGRLNFMHRSWGPLEPFDNSFPRLLSGHGVYSHLISDHLHYFEDGGWCYATAYDSWEFIRGQENDPWAAMVQPPLERFRQRYDDRHYELDRIDPTLKTVTRGKTPNISWKKLRNVANREFIREEAEYPSVKCFAQGFAFLDLNKHADRWLLQVETFDPHEPFDAPARFKEPFRTGYNGKILDWPIYEKVTNSSEEIAEIRANYAALVSMCDEYFGRLLNYFDANDLWKDTALVLTTDHGFLLSEHDWWGKNRMPYYEEISHTPLMIWHPDLASRSGSRVKSLTQTPDLMPTFLEMLGAEVPPEVTGRSLLPVLERDEPIHESIILGMFGGPICATDGRYTYFRYPRDLTGQGFHEYTLMPTHMAAPFDVKEFAGMSLAGPFDFTKGIQVMKIAARADAKRPPGQDGVGLLDTETALYDLASDPKQERPVQDEAVVARMEDIIRRELRRHDAPIEIYENYELTSGDHPPAAHDGACLRTPNSGRIM